LFTQCIYQQTRTCVQGDGPARYAVVEDVVRVTEMLSPNREIFRTSINMQLSPHIYTRRGQVYCDSNNRRHATMSRRTGVNESSSESDDNRHVGHGRDGHDNTDRGLAGPSDQCSHSSVFQYHPS